MTTRIHVSGGGSSAQVSSSAHGTPLSLRSLSSHLFRGRPGYRLQLVSGRRPSDRSMWHRKAWWAGVSSGSLATCPNSELRRRTIGYRTGPRPVREETYCVPQLPTASFFYCQQQDLVKSRSLRHVNTGKTRVW